MRLLLLIFLLSCTHVPRESRTLTIFVSSRNLDYSSVAGLVRSIQKNRRHDVGHAWVRVQGSKGVIEGGHSGELGILQPRYCDGIMEYIEAGDPNPVRYLWAIQKDGFFQKGSGGHRATFSLRLSLTEEQYEAILAFIESYPYSDYAIAGNQCSTFVAQIAALAGVHLECEAALPIEQWITLNKKKYCLWNDPKYAQITLSSPDVLERACRSLSVNAK